MFLPQLMPTDTCKALAYVHKALVDNCTVVHCPNHTLVMPHSVILDIFEDPTCYGAAPTQGQRSLVDDQRGLGSNEMRQRGGSPQRLNRRLEREC